GYGWGESSHDGLKVTVELSSVNRKQSEISIILPRDLEVLEAQIRDEVNKKLARGRVTIRVSLHTAEGNEGVRVQINKPLAQAYARELRAVAKELRLAGDLTVELLIRAPGVLESNSKVSDAEALWPGVHKALS